MKKIALALALVLAGSSLVLATDADAGGGKICKQALKMHPMAGKHRELMKQCKAEYRAYKKARAARYSKRV
jgi:hypothetical protein